MKHRGFGEECLKTHITMVTLVFLAMMMGLGALAVVTKEHMWRPSLRSLVAPISTNAPPPSK